MGAICLSRPLRVVSVFGPGKRGCCALQSALWTPHLCYNTRVNNPPHSVCTVLSNSKRGVSENLRHCSCKGIHQNKHTHLVYTYIYICWAWKNAAQLHRVACFASSPCPSLPFPSLPYQLSDDWKRHKSSRARGAVAEVLKSFLHSYHEWIRISHTTKTLLRRRYSFAQPDQT